MHIRTVISVLFLAFLLLSNIASANAFETPVNNHEYIDLIKIENNYLTVRFSNYSDDIAQAIKNISDFNMFVKQNHPWHQSIEHNNVEDENKHFHAYFSVFISMRVLEEILDALEVSTDESARIKDEYKKYLD